MTHFNNPNSVFTDSKNHYEILDGLRGVASILVILFHVLEIFSNSKHPDQIINHGYLAVDFFFLLSGFVIAHAYDDRWDTMSLKDFFKRRLIRLHPMIIVGTTIGAICFYFQASPTLFPKIQDTPISTLILVMLVGYTLIPITKSLDIRGWDEMHPLDGPAWSLFFEYIANILYALFLRKTSNTVLSILVFATACVSIHWGLTSPSGDFIGGWSIDALQLRIGFTRMLYPFLAGLLLSRLFKPRPFDNAFIWCSILMAIVLAFPRVGNTENLWQNGLYDALMIVFVFPLIVYLGASGSIKNAGELRICRFLGDISYPLYIVHYPFIYWYSAWVVNNKIGLVEGLPMGLLVIIVSISLAYASFKLYDLPVRKWLSKKAF